MSDELVAFVRAQLESDAETIRLASTYSIEAFIQAGADQWTVRRSTSKPEDRMEVWAKVGALRPHFIGIEFPVLALGLRAFTEKFDPDRAMREVEAKRRILDRCIQARADQGIYGEDGQAAVAEDVLKLLALPYADRPGYFQEWRP